MRPLLRPTWLQPTSLLSRLPRARLSRREIKTSATPTTTTEDKTASKYQRNSYAKLKREREVFNDVVSKAVWGKPITLPKIVVTPGSKHHNSLPSYLEYAKRKKIVLTRSVFVGTHYEYVVALSLLRLGFSLIRTGRRNDAGIDLLGYWTLSQFPQQIPVIVQCKSRSLRNACAPKHIRELEGAFRGKPAGWRNMDVLGLLATSERATRGVLNALGSSKVPMGFLKITRTGNIEQFVWNRAAAERGLEGVGVQLRYTPRAIQRPIGSEFQGVEGAEWTVGPMRSIAQRPRVEDSGAETDVQLTWMGTPIFPVLNDLTPETKKLLAAKGPIHIRNFVPAHKGRPKGRPKGSKDSYVRVRSSATEIAHLKGGNDKVPRKSSKVVGTTPPASPEGDTKMAIKESLKDD